VKAQAGIEGNEIADTLAKAAAQDEKDGTYVYDRILISTVASRVREEGLKKMASAMGKGSEWSELQIFLSKSGPETQITDPSNT